MTIDQWLQAFKTATELIAVLVWPAVTLFAIVRFTSPIAAFLMRISEFSFKAPGVEATAKTKQVEAALAIGAAIGSRPPEQNSPEAVVEETRRVASVITNAVTPATARSAVKPKILWVDDRPSNNTYERRALEALGMTIVLSTSTDDALEKLASGTYDVIISDMGRPPDARAGYTLLEEVRRRGVAVPYFIYAGSNAPEHKEEARSRGAQGSTNRPEQLIELVLAAIHLNRR